ncbi:MAG: FAD-dependent oxidoreductase [Clostridia bacterium]|nr:FAD-dependent oxidoreductase [Clostridia bacterium]
MNHHYDLIVAGGGLSGVAAAVSAAREGLRVLLIERNGCLGGALSHNHVFPFMPYWTVMTQDQSKKYLSAGIFAEMNRRHKQYYPDADDKHFQPEFFKMMLDDMVTEAGVDVLFHGTVFQVKTENRILQSLQVATPSGVLTLSATFFVDATGNGDLFALAGCDYQLGRESDGLCQPMTTCFRVTNVDKPLFKKELPYLQEKYKRLQAEGKLQNPRENILVFSSFEGNTLHFNTTRVIKCNPTDAFAVSSAEMEARRQIREMMQFLQSHSQALAHASLISIAPEIGIRESRKLKGVHVLTAEELKALTPFEDSIALGNYDIDIHNPSGSGTSHYYFPQGDYYRIPYRALLPKEYDNLLVAGRCISATHEAQASIRIMPICACLGEAAGTAIAVAHKTAATAHTVNVQKVQDLLRSHGAVL